MAAIPIYGTSKNEVLRQNSKVNTHNIERILHAIFAKSHIGVGEYTIICNVWKTISKNMIRSR